MKNWGSSRTKQFAWRCYLDNLTFSARKVVVGICRSALWGSALLAFGYRNSIRAVKSWECQVAGLSCRRCGPDVFTIFCPQSLLKILVHLVWHHLHQLIILRALWKINRTALITRRSNYYRKSLQESLIQKFQAQAHFVVGRVCIIGM